VLGALATPAAADPREVFGYAGDLGEWELTASTTEQAFSQTREFSGPLLMKHVGVCTQDGPEEKTGEIRFILLNASSRLDATLLVAGVECAYSGKLADFYSGTMACKNGQSLPLRLWVK
jgi:hypothetical protein